MENTLACCFVIKTASEALSHVEGLKEELAPGSTAVFAAVLLVALRLNAHQRLELLSLQHVEGERRLDFSQRVWLLLARWRRLCRSCYHLLLMPRRRLLDHLRRCNLLQRQLLLRSSADLLQ